MPRPRAAALTSRDPARPWHLPSNPTVKLSGEMAGDVACRCPGGDAALRPVGKVKVFLSALLRLDVLPEL
ncbi:hypothetical protein Y1Q_0004968 [Alligator mississippiensis]|uniref:Uncharacterized protein n=1 Tax=Alligator mississippiensis TaxID=8496 RepID=A0A151MYD3_ALLMI|nr:hypothetical protein Y1Q_0004968 [Alligator mississippiensis]